MIDSILLILSGVVFGVYGHMAYLRYQEHKEIKMMCERLRKWNEYRRKVHNEEEAQSAVDGLMNELGYRVDGD